jgi:hypothetical protein
MCCGFICLSFLTGCSKFIYAFFVNYAIVSTGVGFYRVEPAKHLEIFMNNIAKSCKQKLNEISNRFLFLYCS